MTTTSCVSHGYTPDDRWAKLPTGSTWKEATAVATDSRERVYVFARDPHRVLIFDRDGTFLTSWGEGTFTRPHGICIGPDDAVYLTDDASHTVRKFTADGKLLWTLGASGHPSDTGATSLDYRTIRRAGVASTLGLADPLHFPSVRRSSRTRIPR